jgi:hypothetical protein
MTVNLDGRGSRSCGRCNVHCHRVGKLEPWSLWAKSLVRSVYGGFIGSPMESVSDGPPPLNLPLWSLKVGCEAGGQNNADFQPAATKACYAWGNPTHISRHDLSRKPREVTPRVSLASFAPAMCGNSLWFRTPRSQQAMSHVQFHCQNPERCAIDGATAHMINCCV